MSTEPTHHFSVLPVARRPDQVQFVSASRLTLELLAPGLGKVLEDLGGMTLSTARRVYTPESLVICPYFHLLFVLSEMRRVSRNAEVSREVERTIGEITDGTIEGSVRAGGLALEALCEEIYESCFRERAPAVPLGVLMDKIREKALGVVRDGLPAVPAQGDESGIDRLKAQQGRARDPTLRAVVGIAIDGLNRSRQLEERLEKIETKLHLSEGEKHPFFSQQMYECVNRAIDIRNSGSHRRSQTLTSVDVAHLLQGLMNLQAWWVHVRTQITDVELPTQEFVAQVGRIGPAFRVRSLFEPNDLAGSLATVGAGN